MCGGLGLGKFVIKTDNHFLYIKSLIVSEVHIGWKSNVLVQCTLKFKCYHTVGEKLDCVPTTALLGGSLWCITFICFQNSTIKLHFLYFWPVRDMIML